MQSAWVNAIAVNYQQINNDLPIFKIPLWWDISSGLLNCEVSLGKILTWTFFAIMS